MISFFFSDQKVPTELKKAIMQARQEKKLNQAQLAQVSLLFTQIDLRLSLHLDRWQPDVNIYYPESIM